MYRSGISLFLALAAAFSLSVAPATARGDATAGDGKSNAADLSQPIIVAPNSGIDITTAKFGKLDIDLQNASFLEAQAKDIKFSAENMDMEKGTLESLTLFIDDGQFQGFIVDSMKLWTHGVLSFDTARLLNDKVLEFREPASAHARVSVTQASLNEFLNAPYVLTRLSSAAKKRVPILSALARKDVNFGFNFLKGSVLLQPENHVQFTMDSKLGMGKVGVPVTLSADTQLKLDKGWVNLEETHFITGGQTVPKDMAEKIVKRINDLSRWGEASDDVQFEFNDLTVVPGDHLELEGTATIKRVRFTRNQEDKITPPQAAPEQPTETRK